MCTSLLIAELPPLTLCTVQLDSSEGQDNVFLMSNNGSEPAIIRRGILKELFLPRSAFLRGRNSVLGFCAWTIRISCYRSRERATEYFIRDILARNIFVEAKGIRVAALRQLALYICSSCGGVLLNGGGWWCREPEYSGYLAPALAWSSICCPCHSWVWNPKDIRSKPCENFQFQICDQLSFSQLLIFSRLTFSFKCILQSWSEKST